jgi:hypothetical protein
MGASAEGLEGDSRPTRGIFGGCCAATSEPAKKMARAAIPAILAFLSMGFLSPAPSAPPYPLRNACFGKLSTS